MRAALDPNGADAYWAGRFGLIPLNGNTTKADLGRPGDFPSVENTAKDPLDVPGLFHFTQMNSIPVPVNVWKAFG